MNTLDKKYTDLLQDILDNGVKKQTRNGEVLSVFGRQIRHKMSEGFPLLTTKKMAWKQIVTELLWFLRGDTNIKYLVDNDCHIWDGDCFANYLKNRDRFSNKDNVKEDVVINGINGSSNRAYTKEEFINKIKTDDEFAKKWGELGPIYGKQWRSWDVPRMEPNGFDFDTAFEKSQKIWKSSNGMECGPSFGTFCMSLLRSKKMGITYGYHIQIDQIANLINELKTNPDSRRLMVSAWNVGELDQMVLPPCHYSFQVYTRELSVRERSVHWFENSGNDIFPEGNIDDDNLDKLNVPKRAISLMWNQRSVDTALGWPFNVASYGLLLELLGKMVNMVPDELIGNLGDCHIYTNQIEGVKEQIGRELSHKERSDLKNSPPYNYGKPANGRLIDERLLDSNNVPKRTREPYPLPRLNINTEFWPTESGECGVGPIDAMAVVKGFSDDNFCKCLLEEDIQLANYQSHPKIVMPLSN